MVVNIKSVWEQEVPDCLKHCNCCRETIYSVVFSLNVYCNGVRGNFTDPFLLCQSCYSLMLKESRYI